MSSSKTVLLVGAAALLCAAAFVWVSAPDTPAEAPAHVTPAAAPRPLPVFPNLSGAPAILRPAHSGPIAASAPLRLRIPSVSLDGGVTDYTQPMIDAAGGFDPPTLSSISWDSTIPGGLPGTDSGNTVYLYGHSWVDAAAFNGLRAVLPGSVAAVDTAQGTLCYVAQRSLTLGKSQYKHDPELVKVVPGRLVLTTCYRPDGYDPNSATVQNIAVILQLDKDRTSVGC